MFSNPTSLNLMSPCFSSTIKARKCFILKLFLFFSAIGRVKTNPMRSRVVAPLLKNYRIINKPSTNKQKLGYKFFNYRDQTMWKTSLFSSFNSFVSSQVTSMQTLICAYMYMCEMCLYKHTCTCGIVNKSPKFKNLFFSYQIMLYQTCPYPILNKNNVLGTFSGYLIEIESDIILYIY